MKWLRWMMKVTVVLTFSYIKDMAAVIIATDKRSKRRLPSWMQNNDTSKNENFGILDGLFSISGNQTEAQDTVSMIKSMSGGADVVLPEKKKNSKKKEIFAKNYSKKNARKLKKSDGSKNFMCNNSGTKRKSEEKIVKRVRSIDTQHMKLKCAKNNPVKVLSQGMMEAAAELTVEDLISIAEEFLTSDKELQNKLSAARKSESDSIPMSSSESSIPPHRRNINGEIRSSRPLSKCSQARSAHLNNVEQKKHTEESATLSANKIIQSGDAARDMLELFLGPLLTKAPLKEPDPETTRELPTSTYESDTLLRETVDKVDVAEQEPLMKRKSSLKDKVALFF